MSLVGRALGRRAAAPSAKTAASYLDWPWSSSPPDSFLRYGAAGDMRHAFGVPALLAVLRAISNGAQQCPLVVYRDGGGVRERAYNTDQWRLLHGTTEPRVPSSRFVADAALSLAGCGNFYAQKIEVRGRVLRLVPLDARNVKPEREAGEIVYRDSTRGQTKTLYAGELVHVRLAAPNGCLEGLSPISEIRVVTAAALERRDFEQRFMRNDAKPGLIYKSSTPPQSEEEADSWVERWMARHSGPENAGKPTIVSVEDDFITVPVSFEDLQFVEQNRWTREEIAGVYQLPLPYAGAERSPTYEDRQTFALLALGPILGAIGDTLNADPEIFPPAEALSCEPLYDALLQTSARERAETYRLQRQGGWITANEIRRRENLPPADGGDEIQQTPVGGAPNAAPASDPPTTA